MKKPNYIAIAAITLDGKIAKGPNHMSDWTSKEDKTFMRALLDKCDVVIVGNNTYKTAIEPLSKRNCIVLSKTADSSRQTAKLQYINPDKIKIDAVVAERGYKKIAILGGAQTYAYCLKNNLLDELYLTIEPLAFGKGINLFGNQNYVKNNFKLISIKKLNSRGSSLLYYKKYV